MLVGGDRIILLPRCYARINRAVQIHVGARSALAADSVLAFEPLVERLQARRIGDAGDGRKDQQGDPQPARQEAQRPLGQRTEPGGT